MLKIRKQRKPKLTSMLQYTETKKKKEHREIKARKDKEMKKKSLEFNTSNKKLFEFDFNRFLQSNLLTIKQE